MSAAPPQTKTEFAIFQDVFVQAESVNKNPHKVS